MSSYLNIYFVDKETQEYKFFNLYTGSSEFYQAVKKVCTDDNIFKTLTLTDLNEVKSNLEKRLKTIKELDTSTEQIRKEKNDLFVKIMSSQPISSMEKLENDINEFVNLGYEYEYDNENEINSINNALEDVDMYLKILKTIYYLVDDCAFSGLKIKFE